MKKYAGLFIAVLSLAALAVPAQAATVTVEDDKVTVDQGTNSTTVVQPAQTAVIAQPVAVVAETRDPRYLEGEITKVDYPENLIYVRDIDGRERKINLKQGMIGQYKVGDYVEVYLMADMKEAKTIHTRRTADIEGEIVSVDYGRNLIVLREISGMNKNVIVRPGLISEHKVGDRVRLYVTADEPSPAEVRLIRVR